MTELSKILQSLSASSIRADSIVTRMASYSTLDASISGDIASLHQEITRLEALVRALEAVDTGKSNLEYTDEQAQEFTSSFRKTVDMMTLSELRFGYTKSVLATYAPNVCALVAAVLVNSCTERGLTPEPVWQDLLAKNGVSYV